MSKIKINGLQYQKIIMREQEERLNAFTATLIENELLGKEIIEEGYKEVILGVAMLLSQALGGKAFSQTGHNKEVADKALRNQEIMAQIKSTLEDENKTQELVDAMEKQGLKNPDTLLGKNAEKIISQFNKIANNNKLSYRLDTKAVHNLKALSGELEKGYALQNVQTTTDTVKKQPVVMSVKDTIDINFGSDNMFVSGDYELTNSGIDSIKKTIDAILNNGGTIVSVFIESSTDAEQTPKYIDETDPTGNIKLANLRARTVAGIVEWNAGDATITRREIPNNGADLVSTKDFMKVSTDKEALQALRNKTSKFRYVNMSIVAVFEKEVAVDQIPEVIKKYRYDLVKVIVGTGDAKAVKQHVHFNHKKFKCKKPKKGKASLSCETF